MANLTIEMLSEGTDYDFGDFDCGEPSLNAFLTEHPVRQHGGRILRGYLLKERDHPRVTGYYTLSGSCFEKRCFLQRLSSAASHTATSPA